MARSTSSPLWGKTHARVKNAKGTQRKRSSMADELFRRGGSRFIEPSGSTVNQSCVPPGPKRPLFSFTPKVNRTTSKASVRQHLSSHFRGHHKREGEDSDEELNLASKDIKGHSRLEVGDDCSSNESSSDLDESGQTVKEDWFDGSTLIAQYQDLGSETEEERALARVECLQVPLQEKSQELKRDLFNGLITTINDIRQVHIKCGREVDLERGKGIVCFNEACDKRHVDASCLQEQLTEGMADNQVEIKRLFLRLKQAYDNRKQLWVDLQTRVDELTSLQATVLDQLDDNMARVFTSFDKKGKAMLKEDTSKDKEKLLRGVLGKL